MRDLEKPGRSPVYAGRAMACTSQPLATQTAIDVLKSGGNALDAAVAACAVQCVVEPGSTGIGGDCFCLYAPQGKTENLVAFNGSGKAPAGLSLDWFQKNGITEIERRSPHSVTVPGAVDAWHQLVNDHGTKPLGDLLQSAIDYASEGYPLSPRVHADFVGQTDHLKSDENAARIFLRNGKVQPLGSLHRQPELAETLKTIAEKGRDGFYAGSVAEDMVSCLKARGGLHTLDDFASVKGDYVTPISGTFRDHTVYQCPPNGQGVIALLLLNIMAGFDIDPAGPITTERLHLELEACRLAYRARNMYVADPAYAEVPVDALLSSDYADALRAAIDPDRAVEPPLEPDLPRHKSTVYITVVDENRNACSLINTLFEGFGSGIVSPNTGVVFQNRGQGFSLDPDSPNRIEPGKRPLHTIIPAMVARRDRVVMPYGVMGGQYQAFGHMQFLTRFFDFGCDVQEAMDLPRTMADPFTGEVEVEHTIPEAIRDELAAKGHRLVHPDKPIGGSQAIWIDWDGGVLTGGSDPRKDGCAIGY